MLGKINIILLLFFLKYIENSVSSPTPLLYDFCTPIYSSHPYQQILLNKFVKKMPDWKIQPIVGYSNSQYYSKRKAALCEFAELLNSKKTKNGCLDIPDLIIKKEEEKPKEKVPEKSKSYDYRTVSGHLSD